MDYPYLQKHGRCQDEGFEVINFHRRGSHG
jgi:hypothetical protein